MSNLFRRARCVIEPEEVTNARGTRNQQDQFRCIPQGTKTNNRLVAFGKVSLFAAGNVKCTDSDLTFFRVDRIDLAALCVPDRRIPAATTRGAIVPADSR